LPDVSDLISASSSRRRELPLKSVLSRRDVLAKDLSKFIKKMAFLEIPLILLTQHQDHKKKAMSEIQPSSNGRKMLRTNAILFCLAVERI
jgi:hypothetical protein